VAIYRARGNRGVLMLGTTAVVAGLIVGGVFGRVTAPGLGDQVDALRTQAAPMFSSLEVIRLEYPKLLDASGDLGGAEGALARLRATFAQVRPALAIVDPAGVEGLASAIDALAAVVVARAPEADVAAAVDAVDRAAPELLGPASESR
jgi:hypothetical protein